MGKWEKNRMAVERKWVALRFFAWMACETEESPLICFFPKHISMKSSPFTSWCTCSICCYNTIVSFFALSWSFCSFSFQLQKVSMDRNSPPNYVEDSASAALRDVNAFIEYVHSSEEAQSGNKCLGPEPLVTPSIIPRCIYTSIYSQTPSFYGLE